MSEAAWVGVLTIWIVLFAGDPDLHDSVIKKLNESSCAVEIEAQGE